MGQIGEMKPGASVRAHISFNAMPNGDWKGKERLIGNRVAFALI